MYVGALDPVSNKATWRQLFEVFDDDNGEAFDISSATEITVQVRQHFTEAQELTATLSNGKITLPGDTGVFQVLITASEMSALYAGTYDIGCTIVMDGDTTQFIIGTLPVLEGIVT